MNRRRFFLCHLGISLLVSLSFFTFCLSGWYAPPLDSAAGIWHIFGLMFLVDAVLGPGLGWLVYKPGKKTLKFDLAVVIAVQIAAFAYGVYTAAAARPVFVVYQSAFFELVRKNELLDFSETADTPDWQKTAPLGIRFAAVLPAETSEARNEELMREVFQGISAAQDPARYVPLEKAAGKIGGYLQPPEALKKFNNAAKVDKILQKYPEADAWLPLRGSKADAAVLWNTAEKRPVKIVGLKPWE